MRRKSACAAVQVTPAALQRRPARACKMPNLHARGQRWDAVFIPRPGSAWPSHMRRQGYCKQCVAKPNLRACEQQQALRRCPRSARPLRKRRRTRRAARQSGGRWRRRLPVRARLHGRSGMSAGGADGSIQQWSMYERRDCVGGAGERSYRPACGYMHALWNLRAYTLQARFVRVRLSGRRVAACGRMKAALRLP